MRAFSKVEKCDYITLSRCVSASFLEAIKAKLHMAFCYGIFPVGFRDRDLTTKKT